MRTVYFEIEYCVLCYYKEKSLGVGVCKGFLSQEQYREAFRQMLKMVREHMLIKFLLDNRQMKAIRQADQLWTVETLVPVLNKTTLRRVAVIRSADIFNRMAVRSLYGQADHTWTFAGASFDSELEAMRWLEKGALSMEASDTAAEGVPAGAF